MVIPVSNIVKIVGKTFALYYIFYVPGLAKSLFETEVISVSNLSKLHL